MAMQCTDKAGYEVLQEHFAEFCKSGVDPVGTANELFQAKLINAAVREESTCTSLQGRRDVQLRIIIDAVMRQGKQGAFQKFTEIIHSEAQWLGEKFKSKAYDLV